MWIFNEKTMEYLPFSEKVCEKVYLDGANGWAVKFKDGNVVHVSNDVFEKDIRPKLEKGDDDDRMDGMRKFRRKRRLAELLSGKGDNKEAILAALLDDEDD